MPRNSQPGLAAKPARALNSAGLFGREACKALLRNKLRSGLTALGIMIGIAAVVWVVAIGKAGTARAEQKLHDLGDNLVWIEAGSRNINGVRSGNHGTTSLTLGDFEAIRREVPQFKSVSPNVDGSLRVIADGRNWFTHYRGVSPDYLDIKRWTLAEGAPFTDDQVAQSSSVCLIGRTVREQIFGTGAAVGRLIRVQGQPFQVVGVLGSKGQTGWGQDQDDTLIMPYTTANMRLRGKGYEWLDDILASADSNEDINPGIEAVSRLLRQRHNIGRGEDDDFNIRRPEEVIKAEIEANRSLSLLLVSVAAISLVVGGIGIMNVMLASVMQRTREIGLRLAVGATEGSIQLQFLGEAVILCLVGGLAGIAASAGGAFAIGRLLGWPLAIPPQAILLALGFSLGVGIFSGYYPARKAAHLDPIEALRHD